MYTEMIGQHVVVRSPPSGVWMGVLVAAEGRTRKLRDARRAWQWTGAASSAGLAVEGPSGGKITSPVPLAVIDDVCETLAVTDAALARWASIAAWRV